MHIGIIGAGVVGLTTALQLQNEFPNAKITIIADNFYENTTSYIAAGVFRPGTSFIGPNYEITKYEKKISTNLSFVLKKEFYFNFKCIFLIFQLNF